MLKAKNTAMETSIEKNREQTNELKDAIDDLKQMLVKEK